MFLLQVHPGGVIFSIVVGKGLHSTANVPRLKPAIWGMLEDMRHEAEWRHGRPWHITYRMQPGNDGTIEVHIPGPEAPGYAGHTGPAPMGLTRRVGAVVRCGVVVTIRARTGFAVVSINEWRVGACGLHCILCTAGASLAVRELLKNAPSHWCFPHDWHLGYQS